MYILIYWKPAHMEVEEESGLIFIKYFQFKKGGLVQQGFQTAHTTNQPNKLPMIE